MVAGNSEMFSEAYPNVQNLLQIAVSVNDFMINNIFNVAKVLGGGQNMDNSRFLRAF